MRTGRVLAVMAAAAGAGACLAACHKDVTGLTSNDVAGHYVAATFTTTQAGVTTNQLARGSLIDLTLVGDGGTTGRLFVPAPMFTLKGSCPLPAHSSSSFQPAANALRSATFFPVAAISRCRTLVV